MTDSFEIEKPDSSNNLISNVIRYIVLFLVFFFGSLVIIPLFMAKGSSAGYEATSGVFSTYLPYVSFILSISILFFIWFQDFQKIKQGHIFKLYFNDASEKLQITKVKRNGLIENSTYSYSELSSELRRSKSPLFGVQRVLILRNENTIIGRINIDMTAWCRENRISEMINKLESLQTMP